MGHTSTTRWGMSWCAPLLRLGRRVGRSCWQVDGPPDLPEKLLVPGSYSITLGAKRQGPSTCWPDIGWNGHHRLAPDDFNTGGVVDPYQAQVMPTAVELDRL